MARTYQIRQYEEQYRVIGLEFPGGGRQPPGGMTVEVYHEDEHRWISQDGTAFLTEAAALADSLYIVGESGALQPGDRIEFRVPGRPTLAWEMRETMLVAADRTTATAVSNGQPRTRAQDNDLRGVEAALRRKGLAALAGRLVKAALVD